MDEVVSENEGHSFSLHSKLALEVTKEMAKVNVDKLHVYRGMENISKHQYTELVVRAGALIV